MSDEQLERSVAAAFARFGLCWVKIRRDNKGMPFAFVQYQVRYYLSATFCSTPEPL